MSYYILLTLGVILVLTVGIFLIEVVLWLANRQACPQWLVYSRHYAKAVRGTYAIGFRTGCTKGGAQIYVWVRYSDGTELGFRRHPVSYTHLTLPTKA